MTLSIIHMEPVLNLATNVTGQQELETIQDFKIFYDFVTEITTISF